MASEHAKGSAASAAEPLPSPPSSPSPIVTRFHPLPFDVRYCVAPMVGQSDLAFRMLTRSYGASACYTPMLHAARMVSDEAYRVQAVDFDHPERNGPGGSDRPLIAQFAANEPESLLAAARSIERWVDAVDLNLGCPQEGARLGHYGSYLLDRRDWPVVMSMVRVLHEHLTVPVMCKIRLLQSEAETLRFCLELQAAGCAAIAIHGRKRGSTKRRRVGAADLAAIARLRDRLHVPVIANGNIRSWKEAQDNLLATRCQGVMSAEAILANPRLFAGAVAATPATVAAAATATQSEEKNDAAAATAASSSLCIELAHEYLDYCVRFPAPPAHWIADHAHNICRAAIQDNQWMDLKARFKAIGRTSVIESTASAKQVPDQADNNDQGAQDAAASASVASSSSSSMSAAPASTPTVLVHVSTEDALAAIRDILAELHERLLEVQRTGSAHVRLQRERKERRQAAEARAEAEDEAKEDAEANDDSAYGLAGDWESDPA